MIYKSNYSDSRLVVSILISKSENTLTASNVIQLYYLKLRQPTFVTYSLKYFNTERSVELCG